MENNNLKNADVFETLQEIMDEAVTTPQELHDHLIRVLNNYTASPAYAQRIQSHRENIAEMHTALMKISTLLLNQAGMDKNIA